MLTLIKFIVNNNLKYFLNIDVKLTSILYLLYIKIKLILIYLGEFCMRKYNGKSNISGKIIENYRNNKNMTRDDLAKQLQLLGINIDRTGILRIENNKIILKDFELLAIITILNINIEDLQKQLQN